jgi:hypothetical protein
MVLEVNSDHFAEQQQQKQNPDEFTERSCVACVERSDFWNII